MDVKETRKTWGLLCLAALLAVTATWLYQQHPRQSIAEIVQQMEGEHWYRVTFNQQAIGQYRTSVLLDHTIRFVTEMRFRLDSDLETRIEEVHVFAAEPPYQLIRATHTQQRGPGNTKVLNASVLRDRDKLYATAPTGA